MKNNPFRDPLAYRGAHWCNGLRSNQEQGDLMKQQNAFTAKPDISEGLKKQVRSARQTVNGACGPKVPTAHIQIGPRRFGQIKDLK